TWSMLDAGASAALDFIDGGLPSTYRASTDELLKLHHLLLAHAFAQGASWAVVEIADGLLQQETSALLRSPEFTRDIAAWVFAARDPLGAAAGIGLLRDWGIEPATISGRVTMSALAMREATMATGIACTTAAALQSSALADRLEPLRGRTDANAS